MQIIYEKGDLVQRNIFARPNAEVSEGIMKHGATLAYFLGVKTDKPEVYEDCVIATQEGGDWYGRYYESVDCTGGIPNVPSKKGISVQLTDEQMPNILLTNVWECIKKKRKEGEKVALELEHDGE